MAGRILGQNVAFRVWEGKEEWRGRKGRGCDRSGIRRVEYLRSEGRKVFPNWEVRSIK